MKEEVINYNKDKNLFNKGDKIVVGVSGGKDSVCLLHVLKELREEYSLSLFVVHVHHGIRGEEADQDALFVKELAELMGLPYHIEYIKVVKIAKEQRISEEEAGRNERYRIMDRIRRENGFDKVAIAHHQGDVAETVLFHLIRGTGTKGLEGIPPKRDHIIRPILFADSHRISKYLHDKEITFREDQTNKEETYTRNILRLSVFPLLEEKINTQAKAHIADAANQIAMQNEYIEKEVNTAYLRVVRTDNKEYSYDVERFSQLARVIRIGIIRKILTNLIPYTRNLNQTHYRMLEQLTDKKVGKQVHLPNGVIARKTYKEVCYNIRNKVQNEKGIAVECVPFCEHFLLFNGKKSKIMMEIICPEAPFPEIPKKDYTKWIDYDRIENSIFLRNPAKGDYLTIDGEGRRKKLSRYFIDEKIPAEQRKQQVIVADHSHVIAVLSSGRISEYYKVTKETKRILVICIEEV